MADVKPTRRYASPHRAEQAQATRQALLDAADKLFTRKGYSATSVQAIADEARVALKTLYLACGNKRSLLMALWSRRIGGDEEPVPVAKRPWFREIIAEPDPRRQVQLIARNSRAAKGRAGALMEVIRAAAPTDPEIGDLWRQLQEEFHANQRLLIEQLQRTGGLRKDLSAEEATDILWTLNSAEVYQLLVGRRRWTGERYETWLAQALTAQLLRPAA